MRTKKSIINILVNCFSYFIFMVVTFFLQKFLASSFGIEFLGLDSAFSRTVSMLAVVELGLGTGMNYKLFKPIAEEDWVKVASVLVFIKKLYYIISCVIFLLGIVSSFFIVKNIKESFEKIWLIKIFVIYILDVIASYLFFHKKTLFIADQKNYINNIVKNFTSILFFLLRLYSLLIFKSFELYIILKVFSRIVENFIINFIFKKHYSYINLNNTYKFENTEKKELIRSIISMFFHRIGGTCINQIPAFIVIIIMNLKENGIYSNYMYVLMAILGISNEFFNGINASFGNFLNTQSKIKIYENFKIIYFLNFLIYSFFIPTFFTTVNPFIKIWMKNPNWLFSDTTIIFMCLYLYVYGIKQSLDMVKVSAGIYCEDKFFPILEAILNFLFSYFLTKKIGISGIFIGSSLSVFLSAFISQPYFVYKLIFNKKSYNYYLKYIIYFLLTLFYLFICYFIILYLKIINLNLFLQIILNCCISFIITFSFNIFIFKDTFEAKKIFSLILDLVKKKIQKQ